MRVIRGPEALQAFRNHWTGSRLLDLVQRHQGQLRIDWPIGVGKSQALDAMIIEAVHSNQYDLVIALAPTRAILEERLWIRHPPPGIKIVHLRPRPRSRCGPERDAVWLHFEQAGLGALGRRDLCGSCPDL